MAGRLISIYRPDVFECFRSGDEEGAPSPVSAEAFFSTSIATQYNLIAKGFGCSLKLSAFRLEDARRLWIRDVDRIEIEPRFDVESAPNATDRDGIPNHFKQIGFLVYWLRRRCVVESIERNRPAAEKPHQTPQDRFILSGNEICAFLLGFRICQFFEMSLTADPDEDVAARIRQINLEAHLIHDAATLLRHKNLSPHALYLIYRALFYRLDWSQYEERS